MSDFIPYGKQWIDEDDKKALAGVIGDDFITQGYRVEEFEEAICSYTGARYCVAVSSGTAALHIAVAALEIKKGSEGITSPNTFLASANCLVYNDLKPIFADINPSTYCIDPNQIEKKITSNTKVLIPVHFAGQPADMLAISKLAKVHRLFVIEDAAHAIGTKYDNGDKVGSCKHSDMTVFSFHPVKTITTGEGGAITTNSPKHYKRLLMLRSHGITKDPSLLSQKNGPWYYEMQVLGFNYRITDIQAALGVSQLKKIEKFIIRRREIVDSYNEAFKNCKFVKIPAQAEGVRSAFHLYVLQIDFHEINKSRTDIMSALKEKNIGSQVHYIPVHLQPYYIKNFGYKENDYTIAENYYSQCLSLPLYPKMTSREVDYVIKELKNVIGE